MPTFLKDLLDMDDYRQAVADGYVRIQQHRYLPLRILNYTEKTQYESAWNEVTRQCRGLIWNTVTGEIVARPFPKFFNWGQPHAPLLDPDAPALVTDKMDGSLGILYPTPDGAAIATRGSFASEQAQHATAIWKDRYEHQVDLPNDLTLLFEIVYAANRIVLDYGDLDDLVLLGAVQISTGKVVGPNELDCWPGPRTSVLPARTLGEALAAPPRPNAEGLVVRLLDTGEMVKIKQEDYVALHRILTQTTSRTVWEFVAVQECSDLIAKPKHWGSRLGIDPARAAGIVAAGPDWLDKLVADIPDEFHDWLRATIEGLYHQFTELKDRLTADLEQLRAAHTDRRSFAAAARQHEHNGALFLLYDGRDITTYLWRALYPAADKAWGNRSEDVA